MLLEENSARWGSGPWEREAAQAGTSRRTQGGLPAGEEAWMVMLAALASGPAVPRAGMTPGCSSRVLLGATLAARLSEDTAWGSPAFSVLSPLSAATCQVREPDVFVLLAFTLQHQIRGWCLPRADCPSLTDHTGHTAPAGGPQGAGVRTPGPSVPLGTACTLS